VRSDVIADAVQTRFNDAIAQPEPARGGLSAHRAARAERCGAPHALEFSAVFEVYPDVTIGDCVDVAIERPIVAVTPADVDRTLDVRRKQRTTFEPATRAAQAGDRVLVDFTGTIDGVEFPGGQRAISRSRSAKAACCPSSKRRAGMQAGETKTFR
jgi:trigger factor